MRILLVLLFLSTSCFSQVTNDSPYETNWTKDGIWLGASLGLTAYGFHLIQNKEELSTAELANLSENDINPIDRWSAGYYSKKADDLSYIPFYASFATPVIFLLNQNERNHAGQIMLLFVETMATTGAAYTITAGAINRSRPLVYNENLPIEVRTEAGAQRSFIGGHTAATAAATFFAAKVFHDFNPDSQFAPYVWAGAAIVPAWVAYLRLEAGKHFLTDNLAGYAVGALSGILIPELHKKKNENLSFFPTVGKNFSGVYISYKF